MPICIHQLLTDNAKEFIDRLFDLEKGSEKNKFDRSCT